MAALRSTAIVLLAGLGVVAASGAVLWSGSLAGLARVEIVTTNALAPSFVAGDLVLATTVPAAELERGDVVSVSIAGAGTGRLERVLGVEQLDGDGWAVTSAASTGDARPTEHAVGRITWAPTLRVPVVGGVVAAAFEPRYAIPALAGVLLLGAVALVGGAPPAPVSRRV